jgi:hypothetical protein
MGEAFLFLGSELSYSGLLLLRCIGIGRYSI